MNRIESAVARYTEFAIKYRVVSLLVTLVVVAAASYGALRLTFATHFRIWFEEGRPTLVAYDKMVDRFGSDDQAVIGFSLPGENLMTNETLGAIRRMTDALWKVEGVKRVDSLANFATIRQSQLTHESPAIAVTDKYIAAAGDKSEVFVWDTTTFERRRLTGHTGLVGHLATSPDGRHLYSAGLDRSIRIHDLDSGKLVGVVHGFIERISALEVSEDGSKLYVGSYKKAYVVDPARAQITSSFDDHKDYVVRIVETSPGTIITFSRDGHLLDTATGAVRRKLAGDGGFVSAVSTTTAAVYVASYAGRIVRFDLTSAAARPKMLLDAGSDGPVAVSLLALPASGRVVAGMTDGSVRAFATNSVGRPIVSRIHDDWVVDLVSDGEGRVFSASRDRNVGLHTPGEGPKILTLAAHRSAVRRVQLGPDGRLYSLGDGGDVYVWGGANYDLQARLQRVSSEPFAPAVEHDGPKVGRVRLMNGFRYPVEVRAGAASVVVHGGHAGTLSGLPVPPQRECSEDPTCPRGQYCDYEQDEPVCVGRTRLDAYRPGTDIRIWSGEAFLAPDHLITLRVPSDEPFSVTEAAMTPFEDITRVGALLDKYPSPRVAAVFRAVLDEAAISPAGDSGDAAPSSAGSSSVARGLVPKLGPAARDIFLAPDIARAIADRMGRDEGFPEPLRRTLTTLGQAKLEPMRLPVEPWRLREAEHHLLRPPHPAALGNVLNEDKDATMLVVSIHAAEAGADRQRPFRIRRAIEGVLAAETAESGIEFHLIGGTIMDTWLEQYAQRDLQDLGPLFLLVVTLLLGVAYRRVSGVLVPLGLVGLAIATAVGVAGWLGASLNNMTVSVPHVILASCIGDAVHIFSAWSDGVRMGRSPREATVDAISQNFMPCLWTSTSTAIGFFSLCTSPIAPVRSFGWMAGIGVLIAFTMSVVILPAITSSLPAPKRLSTPREEATPSGFDERLDAGLLGFAGWVNRSTGAIIFLFLFFFGFAMYGLTKITIDTNELKFFSEKAPFRRSAEFIEDTISGSYSLQLVADLGEKGNLRKTEYVEELVKLQSHIESTPEVRSVMSIADTIRTMNRVMTDDLIDDYSVPETDALVSSYYDAYTFSLPAGLDLANRVSAAEDATLIEVRLVNNPASWFLSWGEGLQSWADENLEHVKIDITGQSWLYSSLARDVGQGFLENVGSAVLLISIMLLFLARGFRVGMPAVLANIIPVSATVGVLGLIGQALDIAILVSCCVALGVIVDDTTHFVAKYRSNLDKGKTQDQAIAETVRVCGKAMLFTTCILVAGFVTLSWTDFAVNRNFGLVVAAMLLFGLVFDMTALPALIKLSHDPDKERRENSAA